MDVLSACGILLWTEALNDAGEAYKMLDEGIDGNKSQYQARVGTNYDGLGVYESDVDKSLPIEERIELYKKRIATVFNLGGVTLKTDTKKIKVNGDAFTAQKNIYGGNDSKIEFEAKMNALYEMADILSNTII